MAERQQRHQHFFEKWGLFAALSITLGTLGVAVYLIAKGYTLGALASLLLPLATIVVPLIVRRGRRGKES